MSRPVRKYGRARTKPIISEQLFAELPKSPTKKRAESGDAVGDLTQKLDAVTIQDDELENNNDTTTAKSSISSPKRPVELEAPPQSAEPEVQPEEPPSILDDLTATDSDYRVLTWDDVCPFGDRIEKIAEASYAEVYRVTNARGTSIIKVIRLQSPIRPQTKAQQNSGLLDEEAHSEDDLAGELRISEWLADIPGFVVYKERYMVQGKASKALLETHQSFHRKAKRKDPDRLQFYPSPSRYLDGTRFLVVELGDAGTALEDFSLETAAQLWDIFFHTAVALARAEDLARFEHRDLHEGNLCVRRTTSPPPLTSTGTDPDADGGPCRFGYSGLDITILDYGLSRAEDEGGEPVAYDLEKDLGIFTSTHAPQCDVYRRMRSFLLRGDRVCLPPRAHGRAYDVGANGERRIDWRGYYSYTNVLWLAYTYRYLVDNFRGDRRKVLAGFKRETREMWTHLDPEAPGTVLSFSSAGDVVKFAIECGWIREEQLVDGEGSLLDGLSVAGTESIIEASTLQDLHLRRSPRKMARAVV